MPTLRYTLNGTVLTDEPMGWLKTDETLRREETFFSLINEVQGSIDFVKQGTASTESYNIITTAITANPFQELTFLVERQDLSGAFVTEFDGLLPLVGIIHDEIDNFYRGAIVINDVGAQIQNNLDALYFFSQVFTLDGSATITNNAFTNRKTTTIRDPDLLATIFSVTLYRIKDALQGMLDYITNNGITLNSDLFEVDGHQLVEREVSFTGLVVNDVITINFTFFSGVDGTFVHTFVDINTMSAALTAFGRNTFASQEEEYQRDRQGDTNYIRAVFTAGGVGPQGWICTSINNFTIDSASVVGTGTFTAIVDTQEATYGMANLMYGTGQNISLIGAADPIPPSISFKDFLIALNKNFHISFRIIKAGGAQTFKLERFEDFFLSASSLTVNKVQNLTKELIADFNKSTLTVGDAHDPFYPDEVHETASYSSQDTDEGSLDINTSFFTDGKTIIEVAAGSNTTNDGLQDHYFVHVEDATLSPPVTENPVYTVTFGNNYHPINAWLTNMQRIRSNFFQLADNIGSSAAASNDILINNTKARDFIYFTRFDVEISFANFQSMKDGQTEKILYNTDGLTNSEGWIFEIGYNKKTGLAKFILLTEN